MVKKAVTEDEIEIEERNKVRKKEFWSLALGSFFVAVFICILAGITLENNKIYQSTDTEYKQKLKNLEPAYRYNRTDPLDKKSRK